MDEQFMTVAEIAQVLKLNQQTIRNWIDAGQLPAIRIGRRVRIRRSDFEKLVNGGYTGSPATEPQVPSPNIWDGEIPLPTNR